MARDRSHDLMFMLIIEPGHWHDKAWLIANHHRIVTVDDFVIPLEDQTQVFCHRIPKKEIMFTVETRVHGFTALTEVNGLIESFHNGVVKYALTKSYVEIKIDHLITQVFDMQLIRMHNSDLLKYARRETLDEMAARKAAYRARQQPPAPQAQQAQRLIQSQPPQALQPPQAQAPQPQAPQPQAIQPPQPWMQTIDAYVKHHADSIKQLQTDLKQLQIEVRQAQKRKRPARQIGPQKPHDLSDSDPYDSDCDVDDSQSKKAK